jgi:two-component system NarL family response regulator
VSETIRILLVDDHPIVREGLAALIGRREDMAVVGEAANGEEGIRLFRELRPDVTLMDLRMPKLGGLDALAAIRREFPDARVIVLTTFAGDEDVYRAIRGGALSYLLKETPKAELLDTIRAVARGQRRIPPDVAARLAEHVEEPELTPRERDVLELIVKGLSNREIGDRLGVTEGTVKGYVNTLLMKMGVRDRTQAVTAALKRGLVSLE